MVDAVVCPQCTRKCASRQALAQHTAATHDNPGWTPASKPPPKSKMVPRCPICHELPRLSEGKFGTKAECCDLWSWNLKPLVDRETHRSRILAHKALDALWQSGRLSRGECYRRLSRAMQMPEKDCHMKLMTEDQAQYVIDIVRSGLLLDMVDA